MAKLLKNLRHTVELNLAQPVHLDRVRSSYQGPLQARAETRKKRAEDQVADKATSASPLKSLFYLHFKTIQQFLDRLEE